jgi:hypothetical protein
MPIPTMSKHTRWGFALQSAFGTPNETEGDINWMPYDGNLTYGHAGQLELLNVSDGRESPSEATSTGDWGEGDVGGPLYADETALEDLVSWIADRDAYNQPTYASVYVVRMVDGAYEVEGWSDVAVRQAQLEIRTREPVHYTLSLLGREENVGHGVSAPAITDLGVPYNFDAASVQTSWAGGAYADDTTFKTATIVHDNMLEDVGDGFTCAGSLSPSYIFARGGFRATLDLDRKYLTDAFFTEYKAHLRSVAYREGDGTTPSLGFKFIITGTSTLTITLPCVVLNEHPRSYPGGSDSVIPETMRASALRSVDGTTDPISWDVS